jgi:hypothetical protein
MAQRSSSPGPLVHIRSLFSPEAELYDDMTSESDSPAQDASVDQSNMSRSDETKRTFHPFPRLPTELRLKIWELTVEPRTVELCCIHTTTGLPPSSVKICSPTAPPATLHACLESQNHLLKMCSQVPLKNGGWKCVEDINEGRRRWIDTTTQHYVYLNWEMDTVSIGTCLLVCFETIAPLIKSLKFERDMDDEWWDRFESQKLPSFENVEMMHVMVSPGQNVEWWHGTSEDIPWPCGPENVFITDEQRTMRLTDVEDMCDRECERKERQRDPTTTVKFRNGTAYEERQWEELIRADERGRMIRAYISRQ